MNFKPGPSDRILKILAENQNVNCSKPYTWKQFEINLPLNKKTSCKTDKKANTKCIVCDSKHSGK